MFICAIKQLAYICLFVLYIVTYVIGPTYLRCINLKQKDSH